MIVVSLHWGKLYINYKYLLRGANNSIPTQEADTVLERLPFSESSNCRQSIYLSVSQFPYL